MRFTLRVLLLSLLSVTTAHAAPILLIDSNQSYLFTFDQLQLAPADCGMGACVTYNLLSGSGTAQIDVLADPEASPIYHDLPTTLTLGFGSSGVSFPGFGGAASPFNISHGTVRVTLTGDLQFDYFAVTFAQMIDNTTSYTQTITQGVRPILPPHISPQQPPVEGAPEPATLSLMALGVGLLVKRYRH